MAMYVYPAVFEPGDGEYAVSFPDFEGCAAEGNTLEEAIEAAADELGLALYRLEEHEEAVPTPTHIRDVRVSGDAFASLVMCDTIKYHRRFDNRSVRKTLTVPKWLNTMAERRGVNFSRVLQEALKKELGV